MTDLPVPHIPMDPFHTLVTRGWAVDISPVYAAYIATLGGYSLIIRRYDETRVTRSYHLYGDDADELMRTAADIALGVEEGRRTPQGTYIKGSWLA